MESKREGPGKVVDDNNSVQLENSDVRGPARGELAAIPPSGSKEIGKENERRAEVIIGNGRYRHPYAFRLRGRKGKIKID